MKGTVSRHKEIKTMLRIDWEGILKNVLGFSEKRGRTGKEGIEGGKKDNGDLEGFDEQMEKEALMGKRMKGGKNVIRSSPSVRLD